MQPATVPLSAPEHRSAGAKEKFDAVQVLRALAAGLVVFQHAMMNWSAKAVAPGPMPNILALGDYGVKLFFCISGFIILHTAATMAPGWDSSKTFWRRRLKRIVPLYWIMTTVYLLKLLLSGEHVGMVDLLRSYLFIPYLNPHGLVQPVLGQGWSLNYEMLFYVTFGAVLLAPKRFHGPGVVGLMTALAAARFFHLLGSPESTGPLYYWADSVILYFAAGVLCCLAAREWRSRGWPALSQGSAAFAGTVIVLCFAGYVLPTHADIALAWMPVACIVPLLLCITAGARPIGKAWQPMVLGGDASYSTYLTHGFVMGPLARVLGGFGVSGAVGYYGFACISVVLCTAAGYLVFLTVERPLNAKRGEFSWPFRNRSRARIAHALPPRTTTTVRGGAVPGVRTM